MNDGKKEMKACHCFYIHTSPPQKKKPTKKQKQPLGKRRKYLGTFKQNGPSDLNLCFQVNSISKLSIRGCLEEFGPLKAARSEAVGKLLS